MAAKNGDREADDRQDRFADTGSSTVVVIGLGGF
jgi:hypothetical protein